jgi:3'-phosphoadenosine 5'-phosphosulfate sulfotransferase (PAPS reductase)/FAD synthetase
LDNKNVVWYDVIINLRERINMTTVQTFTPGAIGISVLNDEDIKNQQSLVAAFYESVEHVKTLLTSGNVIIHVPVSQGKDSTVVELIVMEAYRQCIAEGSIEPQRPLFLSTVDTLNESIPMKMYPQYCKSRIDRYAEENNINLFYDFVVPGLNDEYFIKYNGGQKLVPNATRRGDCTIFLKLTPSERHVKTLLKRFADEPSFQHYASAKVVTCVGSRTDEGSRRSGNMAQQGIRDKSASDLFAEMDQIMIDKKSKTAIIKYAPIREWSTDDVFDLLRLAGQKPLTRMIDGTKSPIPAFLDDFGLLLEIYGNGSNDVCEVAVGTSKQGSGCNGKARYGCWLCTMVPNDKSSTALTGYERWNSLGAEDALRVRDWLFRLSCDMDARALHARAFDPTAYNRVALQPNVIKPKHLEKMVRYASQLAVDSKNRADAFKKLVDENREMEHPGYAEIANDMMIPPKAKRGFLAMYKEFAQKQLFTPFSEIHAVLLSFRWSIDGIGGAPYRPLAIWKQIESGKGRIPFPLLNEEYEARHGKIKLVDENNKLPEAVMFSIMKNENPAEFAANPANLYDLWQRPTDDFDFFEEDMNCTIERRANKSTPVAAKASFTFSVKENAEFNIIDVQLDNLLLDKIKMNGFSAKPMAANMLKTNYLTPKAKNYFDAVANKIVEKAMAEYASFDDAVAAVKHQLTLTFRVDKDIKVGVPFLTPAGMPSGYQETGRKVEKKLNATQRVAKTVKGRTVFGNTRMMFYSPDNTASLHDSHVCEVNSFDLDFSSHTHKRINVHDLAASEDDLFDVLNNIDVNAEAYARWKEFGGIERSIEIHDDYLNALITKRHLRGHTKRSVRQYGGTHVAERLLTDGPIIVKEEYWKTLNRILKRTQIFNDIGLFNFQSCTYLEVSKHPQGVAMADHRNDRAAVVNELRKMRNKTRKSAKEALNAQENGDYPQVMISQVEKNFTFLTNRARFAVSTLADQFLAHRVKMVFSSQDIAPDQRATVAMLWLAQTFDGVKNMNKVLERTLSQSQRNWIKDDERASARLNTAISPVITVLENTLGDARKNWMPLHDELNKLEATGDAADYRAKVKAIVDAHANKLPESAFANGFKEDLFQFWRPNLDNASAQVDSWCTSILEVVSFLDTLKFQITALKTSCKKQSPSLIDAGDDLTQMSLAFDLEVA